MKVKILFQELETLSIDSKSIFQGSGMINRFNEMPYGFFPLGMGILTDEIKFLKSEEAIESQIEAGGVMVLGNDFGTTNYVDNECNNIGETDGRTIKNLLNDNVGLNLNNTFFTNFHLGLRDNIAHPEAEMRKRAVSLTKGYKEFCYKFFLIQLRLINPSVIICLGHDVKNALIEVGGFREWKKSDTFKKIYSCNNHSLKVDKLDNKTFIVIPHPCDLRNFKNEHKIKLAEQLSTLKF